MELANYLRVLRKQWRLIATAVVLAVGATAALTAATEAQYRAASTFFVASRDNPTANNESAYTGSLFSQQRVRSYAVLLSGPSTAEAVARDLGGGTDPGTVQRQMKASVIPDTVLLQVTVTDPSPEQALAIARSVGKQFPLLVEELERPREGQPSPVKVSVVEQPALPAAPVSPRPVRNLSLAFILGLLLGVGLAVMREVLDNTVKSREDVAASGGLATLGAIAYDSKLAKRPLVVQESPRSARAEAFRQLRTALQFVAVDRPLRSLVVTSSVPTEGKSTTACNLAITLAQAGHRVLLLEADLRRPRVADYLGIDGGVGLTTVLLGSATVHDAVQQWGSDGLHVLASGALPPNPADLIGSDGMSGLLQHLEDTYDLVIVDAPPLLPVTDAAVLAAMTSGALLCVRAGKTKREQFAKAHDSLEAVGAVTLGALLTMVPRRGADAYDSYGYGYGEYSSDPGKPQRAPAGQSGDRQAPPSGRSASPHWAPGTGGAAAVRPVPDEVGTAN